MGRRDLQNLKLPGQPLRSTYNCQPPKHAPACFLSATTTTRSRVYLDFLVVSLSCFRCRGIMDLLLSLDAWCLHPTVQYSATATSLWTPAPLYDLTAATRQLFLPPRLTPTTLHDLTVYANDLTTLRR
ncbi:hypothetical protein B0H17DRAFT_465035 [Mycena rosella]|uniref:Uncharacterized protein n=1 Tax=Mycena rosella TaxID=1033263 RepID=A0AAD7C9W8_MYCRO|nr:hypothetical protein B0H17DRAFT_465035 [Mycena rosella]